MLRLENGGTYQWRHSGLRVENDVDYDASAYPFQCAGDIAVQVDHYGRTVEIVDVV